VPHAFATVVVPFDDARSDAVNRHLDELGNPAEPRISGALDASEFVHFTSLIVVRGPTGGIAHLVLEVAADGYPGGVLSRLAREIGGPLREVLAVAGVSVSESRLGQYLRRHDRQIGAGWFTVPGAVFTGTPGMTVVRIHREAALAGRLQEILDDEPPGQGAALETLQRLRARLFGEGDYKWAFTAEPVPLLADAPKGLTWVRPVLWSLVRTLLWPLLVIPAFVLVWQGIWPGVLALGAEVVLGGIAGWIAYVRFRRKEDSDVPDDRDQPAQIAADIMARENQCAQNHLAAVSTVKTGILRRLALRLALWACGALSTYQARPGFLKDIGTIHFARWVRLPGTDKLLFFSNFTGSWESYLEDFILKASDGLTGVWSNTEGFPRTKNLVQEGAQSADRFKRWARWQQQPTRFWYAAYPDLTTHRIRTNAAIRAAFATASTEAEAASWLGHFRFAPPQVPTVEADSVPTLAFGGLSPLTCARALILRLADEPDRGRAWLADIESDIGYGETRFDRSTLVLGLSATGLRKLGLDERALATFSAAFQHGMAAPWRARALGDMGDNAPADWSWGGPGNEADAILNLYAVSDELLQDQTVRRKAQLRHFGIEIVREILLEPLPPKNTPLREPFGFTDGISQPIIRGTRRWGTTRNEIHVVEPGEMILGYPDNRRSIPPVPSAPGHRDLGRNGTYLVVRQLEQDTTAFRKFLADTASRLVGDPRVPRCDAKHLAVWIGAKILGRWPDGTSLVRYPDRPGSESRPGTLPDNDFLLGTEDPHGLRCPFGAHVRRANPRESLDPGSETQLTISNRHRIFRVGRIYAPQGELRNPGLLFMCVNASIERQFEFVQQTWLLGSSFHELENEIDSVSRRQGLSDVLTIPTENGPIRLGGLGNFVRVRGGEYFFMPGRSAISFLAGRS
jgi:deferrochelatase/peroxidase EfeB